MTAATERTAQLRAAVVRLRRDLPIRFGHRAELAARLLPQAVELSCRGQVLEQVPWPLLPGEDELHHVEALLMALVALEVPPVATMPRLH